MPTTTDLNNWIAEGVAHGAVTMLAVTDRFPWPSEFYPVSIAPGENIAERFAAFDGVNMQRVQAVHLLHAN